MKRSALIVLFSILTACGSRTSYVQKSQQTLGIVYEATKTADKSFVDWDKQHQLEIVAQSQSQEEAKERLTAYRAKRQPVIKAFTITYSAIAAVAAVLPLVEKGLNSETKLTELLAQALSAALEVKAAIDLIRKE